MKEGDDSEDGEAKEEGVTFNVWKKTEQPPPAEPVFDEVTFVPCGNAPCSVQRSVHEHPLSLKIMVHADSVVSMCKQNNLESLQFEAAQ